MIHTILEARVEPEKWELLQEKYTEIDKNSLPLGLLSSHLVQDQTDLSQWRIITFWQSRKDLDDYRKSVETPAWILVFRATGAEPEISISEVIASK